MLVTSDEVVIVASPDLANLRNAKAIVESLRSARANDQPPRLLLNMVGVPRRPEISVSDFSKAVELEPFGIIPFDAKLFGAATNNGQMLAEVDPASKIVEGLDDLGQALMGRSVGRRTKKTLLGPLIERFGRLKAS